MQSWSTLADIVKAVLKDYPKLKLTQGRKVRVNRCLLALITS
jgi:trehalose 6-phosphate phosphatase